ncbi:MAG: maleylacetate reductase, partial [Gammaproteobacteria bacterium]
MESLRESMVSLMPTSRVVLGKRVAEALPEEVERLGARRVFLLVSRSLNRNTDEIERVRKALGA